MRETSVCVGGVSESVGARFVRTEDLAVLEGRLKVQRPALLDDMKSKLRMHKKRENALKELATKAKKKSRSG
jgi:hypothetical protein